jgi:fibronectin-binding autotransporter adhesin
MMSDIRAATVRASGFVAGVALLTCVTGAGGAAAADFSCTWIGISGNDWTQPANWQACNGAYPGSGGSTYDATIGAGGFADLSAATITVGNVTLSGGQWQLDNSASASLTGSLSNDSGIFSLYSQSTLDVAGSLTNSGSAYINSDGGTGLTVTGNLLDSGYLQVGDGTDFGTVTAGTLTTAGGTLAIYGGAAGASTVTVQSAAPASLEGTIDLFGAPTEGAVLAYQSGGITQIGGGPGSASGYLLIDGTTAAVESGGQSGNSALTSLTAVAANGTLELDGGASVTTNPGNSLTNDGNLYVGNSGGGSLAVGGTLTNGPAGYIQVGSGALTSGTSATMTVAGLNNASGSNAWDGVLAVISGGGTATFATGNTPIETLSSSAQIFIDGPQAYVALNAGDTGNTALASLSAVNGGYLDLHSGASLATTTGLTLANQGEVDVDSGGAGGSKLAVGGTLTIAPSYGYILVGNGGLASGQTSTMSVGGLSSSSWNGWLGVTAGSGAASFITGGSAIDAIAPGGAILLNGGAHGAADVELAAGQNSNSALTGLASIGAAASLDLENGESLTTTGGLTNSGFLTLDQNATAGGSSLTVNGVLTETPLVDPYGSGQVFGGITVGNGTGTTGSTLTVSGLASATAGANVLDGNVYVNGGENSAGPNGVAAIVITNGSNGITGIAKGGDLALYNANSLVEFAGQEGSNSALSGLASNAGSLDLANGSAVSTTPAGGTFTNTGNISVADYAPTPAATSLAITGSLANQGGTVDVTGSSPSQTSTLSVSGDLTNGGGLSVGAFADVSVGGTYTNAGLHSSTTVGGTLSAASIVSSGSLQGTGVISGNVTSSGEISGGSYGGFSAGTLTINGDLTQTSSGTLGAMVYDLKGDSSLITVSSGSASLAGGLAAYIEPGVTLAPGDAVTLLTAQNGISGNVGNVQVSYDGTSSLSPGTGVIVDGGLTLSSTVNADNLELTAAATPNQDNWAASANGNWSGAGNWSAGAPVAASNVAVPAGASGVTVTLDDSPTVNSLIVGAGNTLQYASGTPETLTAGNIVTVDSGGTLSMTTAGDALKAPGGAVNVSGMLDAENGASVQASQALIGFGGQLAIDSNPKLGSAGGSSATIAGTLYDTGLLSVGNSGITTGSTVTAAGFSNDGYQFGGAVELTGGASAQALLDVTGPAGSFQPVAQGSLSSGQYYLTGDAALEYTGTPISTIGGGATVVLNGTQPQILANGSNALTALTANQGTLELDSGAALTVSSFANTGTLNLGDPQLFLPDGRQLTNLTGGSLTVTGPAGSFSSVSSGGQLYQGTYYVGPGGTLTFNNGGAGISSIAQSASLIVDGATASIVDSSIGPGQNSALNGVLGTNYGSLTLEHGAALAVGSFENPGTLGLVGGTLSVNGTFNSIDQENPDTPGASAENALHEGTLVVSSLNADGSAAGSAALVLNGQSIQEIDDNATLVLNGANASVALAGQTGSNSALTSLSENEGTLEIDNGAAVAASQLENSGKIVLGGGSLTLSGPFQSISSQGTLYEGSLVVSSDYLVNPANYGGGAGQTSILERSNVGPGSLTYNGPALTGIGSGASLALVGANASITDGTSNALATLASNAGTLDFELGAAATLGSLTNSGTLQVDSNVYDTPYGGLSGNGLYLPGSGSYLSGGSTLTVSGTLANASDLQVGNSALTSAATLDVNDFSNTGTVSIAGSRTSATPALIDVTGAFQSLTAAGELASGSYYLSGDAQLEYSGAAIGAIGPGVAVSLDGAGSYIELAGQTGSNSALAALADNSGTLTLTDGAAVATASGTRLTNTGTIEVDFSYGGAGSTLAVGGPLTNSGSVLIGNGGIGSGQTSMMSVQGLADASGNATHAWSGFLSVTSGKGTAALVTDAQPIDAIGPGASIFLDGAGARIENSAADTSSTALASLGSNAGALYLSDGATVTTASGVNLVNSGTLAVDAGGSGGSSLSVGGGLYNLGGFVEIGNSGLASGESSMLSVDGLADVGGNPTGTWEGYLSVTSGQGTAALVTDGNAVSAIDAGATITLNGPGAYIKNGAGDKGSTALASLSSNAGTLMLSDGATVATGSGVGLANSGTIQVDDSAGSSGSSLSVGGALSGYGQLYIGNSGLGSGQTSTVSVNGLADSSGNPTSTWYGSLTVTSGKGTAALATGTAITGIDSSSFISLDGPGAFVEKTAGDGSSTALASLDSNAGYLYLNGGASVATAPGTSLVNTGVIYVDDNYGSSGSSLSVGGALADEGLGPYGYDVNGQIYIGNSGLTQGESSTLSVHGLEDINGAATNTWYGDVSVTSGQGTAALVTGTAITTIGTGAFMSLDGPGALVENTAGDGSSTALASLGTNSGYLYLNDGASVTTSPGANLVNGGQISLDDNYGSSGSSLSVGGTLVDEGPGVYGYSDGSISIGNAGMTQGEASTMTVHGLEDTSGNPTSTWNGNLTVTSGQGTAALVTGTAITSIASGSVSLDGPGAYVEKAAGDGSSTALTGLASNAGYLYLRDGASVATAATNLLNTGVIYVDDYGSSGSSLAVGGLLGNTGFISVGNSTLAKGGTSTISAQGLADASGNPTNAWSGTLDVTSGQGVASFVTGGAGIDQIASYSSITIDGGQAFVEKGAGDKGNTALGALASIGQYGDLYLENGAAVTTSGTPLVNAGSINVDGSYGSAGSSLTAGGVLTNTGRITIGNAGLAASQTSTLSVQGLQSTTWSGSLSVTSGQGAASFVTGNSPIDAIGSGGQISLDGPAAFVEGSAGDNGNTALTGLASNAGYLYLDDGAKLSTGQGLTNAGVTYVDEYGSGGSSLSVGGALANTGYISIGNSALASGQSSTMSVQGLVDSSQKPTTVWGGDLLVTSGQGTAAFVTGGAPIDSIGSGAEISLDGAQAYVQESPGSGTSDALAALSSNAGTFSLNDGATVTTAGTGMTNTGDIYIDSGYGSGGSGLTVGGALANTGYISIGNSGLASGASSTMSVQGFADSSGNPTTLWSGNLLVTSGAGTAALVTGTGAISTIGSGAQIDLTGPAAYVESSAADKSNSALATLDSNAGNFYLYDGAAVSSTASSLSNTGTIQLQGDYGSGGSRLQSGGTLSNSGSVYVDTDYAAGGSSLTAAGALANSGTLSIGNSGLAPGVSSVVSVQGLNDASGNPTTTWSGDLTVTSGQGTAALEVGNAAIDTIGSGAQIYLDGPAAYVESGTPGNSALATLAADQGNLYLYDGAAVSSTASSLSNTGTIQVEGDAGYPGSSLATAGTLSNSGYLYLDSDYGSGGSSVTVGGALTDTGLVSIGNSGLASGESSMMSVQGLSSGGNPTTAWSGNLSVTSGQGTAALVTGTGQIASIGAGGQISLDGSAAYLENGASDHSNSALATLASNAGTLSLNDGATVATTASSLTNTGYLYLDDSYGAGGSGLTVGGGSGSLTNSGYMLLGNGGTSSPTTVTAGTVTNNASATIELAGNSGAAGGTLTAANLVNGGSIYDQAGYINVGGASSAQGGFAMSSAATMTELIGGISSGEYGTVYATGNVALAGTLSLQTINGFSFAANESFNLINLPTTAGALTGNFATLDYGSCTGSGSSPLVCGNLQYTLSYDQGSDGQVILAVTNAPTSNEDDWQGGTDTWNNATNNATNWSDGALPTTAQNVKVGIGAGGTVTYNDANDTVNSLTIQQGTSTGYILAFDSADTLTATNGVTIGSGGEIDVETSGAALDASSLTNTGGTLKIGGNGGGTVTLTPTTAGTGLGNAGTVDVNAGGTLALNDGTLAGSGQSGTYDNASAGTIALAGGTVQGVDGTERVTNEGAITGNGSLTNLILVSTGTITPTGGALTVTPSSSGLENDGSIVIGAGDTLAVTGPDGNTFLGGSGSTQGGAVTVDGGTWTNSGFVQVGGNGATSTILVENGGTASEDGTGISLDIGQAAGSTGSLTVTGAGSTWSDLNPGGGMLVGDAGAGAVIVANGGSVSTLNATIGGNGTSTGTGSLSVDGTGSSFASSTYLTVGDSGTGSLAVTNGGTVSVTTDLTLGSGSGATGTATVSGGSLDVGGTLAVGPAGKGSSLAVGTGGQVTASVLHVYSGSSTTDDGTIDIGTASTPGTVDSAGSMTVGSGSALDVLDGGSVTNEAGGQWLMQGGSVSAGAFANAGTVSGNGTIGPQVQNTGTVEAAGGTLTASGGVTGTGTVQTDSGATLSLGGNSSAGTLTNNGTLALGTNSITVSGDYDNGGFGTGNSFNAHANVSGSGQILAAGDVGLSVTGADVTGGTTSSPTLALGNVHVGKSTTTSYSINATGTSGPSLRGAVENTGITDGAVTVAAANYGPLAPGASQSESVTYDPGTAGALTGQSFEVVSNFDNVGAKTVAVTGAAYDYANPVVSASQPIDVGNFHVGSPSGQVAVPIANAVVTNASYQEGLDASVSGASGSATSNDGTISLLAAGGSSNAITVGLDGKAAGVETGSVTLNLTSDGQGTSGLGTTALSPQTVTVTGTGYNLAQSSTIGTIDLGVLHAGTGTVTQAITVSNIAPAGNYTEGLDSSFGSYTNNGGSLTPTFTGSITNLAGGGMDNTSMTVSLSTATAGVVSGNIAILQDSNGTIDGLGNTTLPTQNPAVSGTVEAIVTNLAQPQITNAPISFGNVRIGTSVPTQGLSVTNAAPVSPYSEGLIASVTGASGGATATGGFGSPGKSLAAGTMNNSGIQIGIDTSSAGQVNGTATVDFESDGTPFGGTVTDLGNTNVGVTGTVYRLATGSAQDVNLGATRLGGALAGNIAVTNTAANDGYSENLDASITGSTPAVSSTGGAVTGLAAGKTNGSGLTVALETGVSGNVTGTATVQFQSDGTGIDNGAPIDNGSQTVNVTGKVYTPAVAQVNTQSVNFGVVHVGQTVATQAVSVSNVAATTATSLNDVLQGALTSVSGPFTAQGNLGTGNSGVAAGGTDSSSLQVGLDTTQAGAYSGSATFSGVSHDQDLADVAAQAQGSQTVSLSGQVNNYADAVFALDSGGTLTQNGSGYLLDLGNLTQNSSVSSILLSVLNDVSGSQQYTDYLQGGFSEGALNDLSLQGTGWSSGFGGLEAGQSFGGSGVLGLAVDTATLGSFTDTIDLTGLGYYPGAGTAYSYADNLSLTVEGDIVNSSSNVPEPGTLPLFLGAAGMLALALSRRRLRERAVARRG